MHEVLYGAELKAAIERLRGMDPAGYGYVSYGQQLANLEMISALRSQLEIFEMAIKRGGERKDSLVRMAKRIARQRNDGNDLLCGALHWIDTHPGDERLPEGLVERIREHLKPHTSQKPQEGSEG